MTETVGWVEAKRDLARFADTHHLRPSAWVMGIARTRLKACARSTHPTSARRGMLSENR